MPPLVFVFAWASICVSDDLSAVLRLFADEPHSGNRLGLLYDLCGHHHLSDLKPERLFRQLGILFSAWKDQDSSFRPCREISPSRLSAGKFHHAVIPMRGNVCPEIRQQLIADRFPNV